MVVSCGVAEGLGFGVEVSGSSASTGGGLLLNSLTRAHVIMLSKYLYTGSLSSSRILKRDKKQTNITYLTHSSLTLYSSKY